uniref:Putative ribonuclease H-like domain-containing protein n=1 Tax=Tanacetum cinerariifolium TaxID=118510 RepID=A0A699I1B4_TANCI|nr:putative ribonuclease H-like domain-containing protein [Tanacetum cinerariifolium]
MCDKKKSVLFTETQCLVLSLDITLLNENQVLLKVPRQNNMYSFDLKNVAPSGGLTCLFAKATIDESNLWHRRLGHIKFKAMNKLVRGNLVRGLPSKIFENDHTCVACQKGKQHKAFCKTKLVSSVSQPLQMLHIDLFGLKFVKSLNNKMYFLVVTDDFSRSPNLDFMRPFGCPVTILNALDHLGKFKGKADERFLVGYSVNSKAFRVFNSKTRKVEEYMHIIFLENKSNVAGRGPKWLIEIDSLTKSMNYEPVTTRNQTNNDAGIEINVNARQAGLEKAFDHEYIMLPFMPLHLPFSSSTLSSDDKDPDEALGKGDEGISKESKINDQERTNSNTQDVNTAEPSINTANTNINSGSLNINIVGSTDLSMSSLEETGIFHDDRKVGAEADTNNLELLTVVIRNKKDERGIIVKKKARLVAQGYTQEEGINYDEVFSPVTRIEAIRLFLAYASFMGFIVYQMDVKSGFLYVTIEEEVYVCQPPSFEDPHFPNKVYKVEKTLYGLHQAPKAWYETLSTYLLENRFRRGTIDKTLFIKKDRDDILLVQVKQKDDGIFIIQDKYMADILKKFDFTTVKTTSTPMEPNKALINDAEAEDVDVHLYRSMIRSLMYLTASKPDIMFVVCACAKFQVTPNTSHLHSVKRIFRYIKEECCCITIEERVNELRAERLAKNANPIALVATAQANQDPYYQTSKSQKSYAPSSEHSIPTRSHTTTIYKGKEIAKPITPPSESSSEEDSEDSGPEQDQRDKDTQKNLALIGKYFKKIYKPANNNLRTSSNLRNKNVDMTSWYKNDNQSGQFWNQRTMNVVGARENEVPTVDICTDSEPLEQVQNDTRYNVFANDLQHYEQSESISNICIVETDDSNAIPDSPYMCDDDIHNDQNDIESDDERVALANLKLDVDENKKIQKQLKKANTILAQELKECKTILAKISKTLGESNSVWDSCLVALQKKQIEFEKYKAFNDRTVDYDKLERKLNETLGLLAQTDIEIK